MSWSIKGIPFMFKGVENVEDCNTASQVMIKAKLDWTVAKCEMVAKMPVKDNDFARMDGFTHGTKFYKDVPNAFGIYREDNNAPLGVVKGRYTPVQNIEAFNFFDGAIGKDKAVWQTAGCFGDGQRVFVSAKLPKNILVKGIDPVDNYLIFTTTHDGTGGVKILLSPIRPVCGNTLSAAIQTTTNYVSFRHTSSVLDNITTAKEVLGIAYQKIDITAQFYEEMYKKAFTDNQAQSLFASVVLTEAEIKRVKDNGYTINQLVAKNWQAIEDSEISMKKVNVIHDMNKYYFEGPGQRETLGNGWGVYNAVTGYYSNIDNAIGFKRMDSLLYGDKSRKIETAGNLILEYK